MRLAWIAVLLTAWAAAADLGPDLLAAARRGQNIEVAALLNRGASVESAEKDGRTALMFAAQHGHAATVKLLLDRGANPDARDRQGWTAYGLAVIAGRDDVVKLFPPQPPIAVALEVTWVPENLYTSCFMKPQQLLDQVAGLQLDAQVAAALREYRDVSGKRLIEFVDHDPQITLAVKARPGASCVLQRSVDNLNLAIDAKVTRANDQAVLLEKTFGGGLKGIHARAVSGPAQYGSLFSEWAKSHASSIYWAAVEAWLRAR